MEVICENCKVKMSIPDEKIPKDQAVRIACPKCKKKIVLDPRKQNGMKSAKGPAEGSEPDKLRLGSVEPEAAASASDESYGYEDYAGDEALQFFEEGTRLALIMPNIASHGEKAIKAVEGLGYKAITTPDTRDAIGKMRFHRFDMVILMDGFDGHPLERSGMLNYLNRLNMSVRRRIFVALVSENFKTMDDMMALAISANVVINTRDLEKLHPILKKAISENEKFYKVFLDTMVETGKA